MQPGKDSDEATALVIEVADRDVEMLPCRFVTQLQVSLHQCLLMLGGEATPYGDGAALSLRESTAFVCVPGAVPPARLTTELESTAAVERGTARTQGSVVGRMQRIVIVAGGAEAHQLVKAAMASIQEAQSKECNDVLLTVYLPKNPFLAQGLTPRDAASAIPLNRLHDNVRDLLLDKRFFSSISAQRERVALLRVQLFSADSELIPLNIQAEIEDLEDAREDALFHDSIWVKIRRLATRKKIAEHVARFQPHIVQFSGHGSRRELQFFREDAVDLRVLPSSAKTAATTDQLALSLPACRLSANAISIESIALMLRGVRCVFLNCCNGKESAALIHERVPFVVYYDGELSDVTARVFSKIFWQSLFRGHGIIRSFATAQSASRDSKYQLYAGGESDRLFEVPGL
eukprot:m.245902 g.245902  ORF g.245902 m.245902 type:complete len:404 (-) comp10959_c0_seq1:346-1557(-)